MSALHKDLNYCYFGKCKFAKDKYGEYTEEVGEFWNKDVQQSVLAHPDCCPDFSAIIEGTDPIWSLA